MFSIVIPTYKRDQDLEECLQSIRENSTDKNIEVIVLHGGFDSTAAVCEKYGALSVLDHARENGKRVKSLWAIINDGIKMAKSQYVLYLNDDCLVMPGWDTICAKNFEDKKTEYLLDANYVQYLYSCYKDNLLKYHSLVNKSTHIREIKQIKPIGKFKIFYLPFRLCLGKFYRGFDMYGNFKKVLSEAKKERLL